MLRSLWLWPALVVALLFSAAPGGADEYGRERKPGPPLAPAPKEIAAQLRRPAALAFSADGKWLFVANRDSGTVTTVDVAAGRVLRESKLGKRLVDLVPAGGDQFLAVDEFAHELLLLKAQGAAIQVAARLAVSPYPVSVVVSPQGDEATVASLWSKRLTFVKLAGGKLEGGPVLDLAIAPRRQVRLEDKGRLLVADSFGGKLAVIDLAAKKQIAAREFPGHNIRGLGRSTSGEMILVAHQMLNELAHTNRNDVHWGLLMSNDLRWLRIDSVLAGGKETYFGSHMHPLGEAGRGAADPGGLDVAPSGMVVVTISGTDEVSLGKEEDFSLFRVQVGKRPVAVKVAPNGELAYVANQFDDSLTVVNLNQREATAAISLGPTPELTLSQKGELLFHDGNLSHDAWMTCQSCHTDGHANGQTNDNFSDFSFGASKRVLSLLDQTDTAPYSWAGKTKDFAQQIRNSVEKTMQGPEEPTQEQVDSLVAYITTLKAPPPVDRLRNTVDQAAIARGQQVFTRLNCANCHAPPTYTSPKTYDVGIHDKQGNKEFNPPSLRGISHRGPFFHDNSAATLEDVFLKHGHPGQGAYSAEEIRDLVAFLRSL